MIRVLAIVAIVLGAGAARAGDLESAGRKLVDKWVVAQNKGDFATYASFYAKRFTGIRRSGPRTVRLDRAGWMKDRERMFKKPMLVGVADVKVTGMSTVVTFTQTWQSGAYKDVGPKQLVLVVEAGQPKIAREELLASDLQKVPPLRDQLTFVLDDKWVLIDDSPDENVAVGDPRFVEGTNATTSWKAVAFDRLSATHKAWRGRKLTTWDKRGTTCATTVVDLQMVSRAYVHFGQLEEWKSQKPDQIAPQAWEIGSKLLVGVLAPACKGTTFARDAALPLPKIVVPTAPSAAQQKRVLAALHALPRYAELQRNWQEEKRGGAWEEKAEGALVETKVFTYGERTWLSVTATAGEGCGGWSGDLFAVYEEQKDGTLQLRNRVGSGVTVTPLQAVDIDGDGQPELLFEGAWWELGTERGFVRPSANRGDEYHKLASPFFDCPC